MSKKKLLEIFVYDRRNNRKDNNSLELSKIISKIQGKISSHFRLSIIRVNSSNFKTLLRRGIKTIPSIKIDKKIFLGLNNCKQVLIKIMSDIQEKENIVDSHTAYEDFVYEDALKFYNYVENNGSARGYDDEAFGDELDTDTIKRKIEEQDRVRQNMRENLKYNKNNKKTGINAETVNYGSHSNDDIEDSSNILDYFAIDDMDAVLGNDIMEEYDDRVQFLSGGDFNGSGTAGSFIQ